MKKRLVLFFLLVLPIASAQECCLLNGSTSSCSLLEVAYQGSCKASAYVLFYEDLAKKIVPLGIVENGKLFQYQYVNSTIDFYLNDGALEGEVQGDRARFANNLTLEYKNGKYGLKEEHNNLLVPSDKIIKGIKMGSLFYESNTTFNRAISYQQMDKWIHFINYNGATYESRETVAVRGTINDTVFAIEPGQLNYLYAFQNPLPLASLLPNNSLEITFLGAGMTISSVITDGQRLLVSYQGLATIANNDPYQNAWKWKVGAVSYLNLELLNNDTLYLHQDECAKFPNSFISVCYTVNEVTYDNVSFNPEDSLYNMTMMSLSFKAPVFIKENKAKKIYITHVEGVVQEKAQETVPVEVSVDKAETVQQGEKRDLKVEIVQVAQRLKRPLLILVIVFAVLTFLLLLRARGEE